MSISSINSNPVNSTIPTIPIVPSSPGDSYVMPFDQVLNETIMKTNLGQTPIQSQGTSSLAKPTLSILNFLKTSFLGKAIPVTDDQRHIVETGRVISMSKVDKHYEAILRDPRAGVTIEVKMIFEKQPLGQSYKIADHSQETLRTRADMEQRLGASVSPLMASETGSVYNPLTIPDVPVENPVAEGELLEFYNPQTDTMESGSIIIMKGRPYLRDEGVPLSLRAERL